MFEVIFKDNLWNWQLQFASFYVEGQLRLEIRIWDYFWTHFDAMNLMTVSELENECPLEIVFFEVSTIVAICVKFQ